MNWRDPGWSIVSLLFISLSSYGQWSGSPMHFSDPPTSIHLVDPLFNKVLVVENRFDTSPIVNVFQGKQGLILVKWDTALKTAIQNYVQTLLDRSTSAGDRSLLIELRRYQFNGNGMHFWANAYYSAGDNGFIKFASMDTVFRRRPEHYLTGAAIAVFLEEIMLKRPLTQTNPDSAVSLSTIESNNVMHEWASLPINTAGSYPPGVYEGYTTLRKNQPYDYALRVDRRDDSVYVVTFTDTLPEKRKRIISWLDFRGRGVISYNSQLYYLLDYPVCLPLVRKNNTFYFHIPSSLPNMYYLDKARTEGLSTTSLRDLGPIRNAGDGVAAGGALVIGTLGRQAEIKAIKKEGIKDPTMRDCYIDLGTGILHYD
jgi:hypothetical protein